MTRVVDNPLYGRWNMMKQRCLNPNNRKFQNYGKRGIEVCEEWMDFKKFEKWALSNGFEKKLTLDRVDTNGNYEPSNCRWATQKTQQNNRSNNRLLKHEGKEYTLSELSELSGIHQASIVVRLKKGMTTEQAISTGLNYDHIEIQIDGEVNNLKRWCEIYNLPYKTIHARVKRGWDPIEAISKPIRVGDYHRNKA